jgi:predicted acyl esterase
LVTVVSPSDPFVENPTGTPGPMHINWFRLVDGDARTEPAPVRIFVMGANEWRDEQQWPPATASSFTFYLSSGGRANSRFGDGALSTTTPESRPAVTSSSTPPSR